MISRVRAAVSALGGLAVVLGMVAGLGVSPARADGVAPTGTAPSAASADRPVVVAGVAGLEWSDLDKDRTPNLWRLVGGGDVASIAVRTLAPTCPVDAWLTVSAGNRVAGTPQASPDAGADGIDDPGEPSDLRCRPVPHVDAVGTNDADTAGVPDTHRATVVGWDGLAADDSTAAGSLGRPGTLGEALAGAGVCSTAIGPGAAIALARADGSVDRYLAQVDELAQAGDDARSALLTHCPVTVVDLGELPDPAAERSDAVRHLDATVGMLDRALPTTARLLVAGVADTPLGQRGAGQVAVERGTGAGPAWLTSASSRREGVVVVNDLAATVAAAAGVDVPSLDGRPLERGLERRLDTRDTVDNRQYLTTLTQTTPPMNIALLGLLGIVAALCIPALVRRRGTRLARATLTVAALLPVSASLATLSRWWTSPAPGPMLAAAVAVPAVVLALLVWALDRPARRLLPDAAWRRPVLVAALTWAVLTVDALTGTTLQQGSPLGPSLALGARFYGFGNTVFAVYSVAALVLAAGLAAGIADRHTASHPGRRRLAAVVAGGIGAVTVVVNGLPSFGADAGGIVALVPAFVVLVILLRGQRVRPRHWVLAAATTLAVVVAVSLAAWLVPGGSHLGQFVQRIVDGDAVALVTSKAAGALATITNVPGALAAIAVVALAWAVLAPGRRPWERLAPLTAAYRARPTLGALVIALVTVAGVGSVLNDTGVGVGVVVVLAAATTLAVGDWRAQPALAGHPASVVPVDAVDRVDQVDRVDRVDRGEPRQIVTVGSGALLVFLMVAGMMPPSATHGHAGALTASGPTTAESAVASPDVPLVVIGTSGLRWPDLHPDSPLAPRLARMLADGADAGGVALPTGRAARCQDGGWLALSAGQLAEVSTSRADGAWVCPDLSVDVGDGTAGDSTGGGATDAAGAADAAGDAGDSAGTGAGTGTATVQGWDELVALQRGSGYGAVLGRVGDALAAAPSCATAVGPGAAVALADGDGNVARYRTLEQALAVGTDAFTCPVTVVDAGAVRSRRGSAERADEVAALDLAVARTVAAAPADAQVLVVDVGQVPGARPELGIALVRPAADSEDLPRYLSSTATRTDGVARLMDVPATLLDAAGVAVPSPLDYTPLIRAGGRPADGGTTADELADVTARDHVRRAAYVWFVDYPFYLALAAAAAFWIVGARFRRRVPPRLATVGHGLTLLLAALPAAAFLGGLTGWWHFSSPGTALAVGTALTTVTVAALATLAPRHPVWARPAVIAGITFVVLSLDGVLGTPLNRTSPLGSAPTFGARFFGFGNPTFSVYAVAALVFAGALGQLWVHRGRQRLAGVIVAVIGFVAMVIDVWPTFGADLGGGLVLVPAFVLIGFAAWGARVTFKRFVLVAAAGVGAVAAVGVLDWLRPPAARSHLGRFVDQVINGEAWALLWRKATFAARSILGGAPVWLTVVVLVAAAVVLLGPARVRARWTPRWLARIERRWPLVRPTLLAIWVISVLGSVVNDFGLRIAMIALIPAVPLVLLAALNEATPRDSAAD